jgi:phosphoribosylglycinamide formyltransferase-1
VKQEQDMKNIAVFASGNGTNLQAIIDNTASGALRAHLALVVSDKRSAFALRRAKKAGIKTLYADPKKFDSKQAYEEYLISRLKKDKVDLIILAGFMRILSPFFIKKYRHRILNIHPALLPAFKGACAIKDAFKYGVKVTGVTVHFVDEKVDHGPIILQEPVSVPDTISLAELEARIHRVEHKIYTEAIRKVLCRSLPIRGRKVLWRP